MQTCMLLALILFVFDSVGNAQKINVSCPDTKNDITDCPDTGCGTVDPHRTSVRTSVPPIQERFSVSPLSIANPFAYCKVLEAIFSWE